MGCRSAALVLLPALALLACDAHERAGQPPDLAAALSAYRIVDLSHPFDDETLYWPTSPSDFELEVLAAGETEAGYYYSANRFCTPEHGGTHLDAPIHFAAGGQDAAELPLEDRIAPAVVLDLSREAARDPDYRLTREDVERFEAAHGPIPAGSAVLLRTDWSERWPDAEAYLGDDTPGDASNLHFPSYGAEAARLLVEERKVALLGVDTASIDFGPSRDFRVHRIAARADVAGLENLRRLRELPPRGAWLIALPLAVPGSSGGPVRAVALVPRESAP